MLITKTQINCGSIQGPQGPAGTNNIFEFDTFEDFPAEGEIETLYIDKSTNLIYRWETGEYIVLSMPPLNYAVVSIEASDPSEVVIPNPSTGLTFDPADPNNHYVDAHPGVFNFAHEYTSDLTIRSDGRIETLRSGLHMRVWAYCGLSHSLNNATIAMTVSIELPGTYPIVYSPAFLVTNLDLKNKPGMISGSTIFPCPYGQYGLSNTVYGLSFASDLAGTITIISSNFTLEVIN